MLFRRTGTNAIAKIIRNSEIGAEAKKRIIQDLVRLFKADNPLWDAKQFRQLCSGKLEKDPLYGWREKDE
jgi:hypothetical protein